MRHGLFLPSRIYTRGTVHTEEIREIRGVSVVMIPEIRSPVAERRRSKCDCETCRLPATMRLRYHLLRSKLLHIYILIMINLHSNGSCSSSKNIDDNSFKALFIYLFMYSQAEI